MVAVPSEYGLYDGKDLVARILRMGDGWRACRPSDRSVIGTAVSPVGLNGFREVRDWVLVNL
jgi:hypothetical protein